MSENNHDDFNDYMKFWIFKKEYEEGEVKVKVHNYITGKYGGSAHQKRNLNLSLAKKIPAVFYNLQKPIFTSYLSRNQKIHSQNKCFTKNNMSFTIEKAKKKDLKKELPLVFINSIHFLNNSAWKSFIMNTMKDYHDLYLKVDVLLLACGFETFRKESTNNFELDSAHYLSTLGYSWDVMLRFYDFNLKLISVIEKYQFMESTLRGCISVTFREYADASNKFSKSYYAKKSASYIMYLEANNLYELSTMKLLPTQVPDQVNLKGFSLNNYSNDSSIVCFL